MNERLTNFFDDSLHRIDFVRFNISRFEINRKKKILAPHELRSYTWTLQSILSIWKNVCARHLNKFSKFRIFWYIIHKNVSRFILVTVMSFDTENIKFLSVVYLNFTLISGENFEKNWFVRYMISIKNVQRMFLLLEQTCDVVGS